MSQSTINRELFDVLSLVNRKLRAYFDAEVRERGLTLSRVRTLAALARRDGLNQRELAEELDIETPTIVRLIDGMEKQGFVERRVQQADRRAKQIHMTARGKAVADEIEQLARDIREKLLDGVPASDKTVAIQLLRIMADNLQRLGKE